MKAPHTMDELAAMEPDQFLKEIAPYTKPHHWQHASAWRYSLTRAAQIDAYKPIQSPDRLTTAEDLVAAMNIY